MIFTDYKVVSIFKPQNNTINTDSGVARYFGIWGEQSQCPPITEIMDFKQNYNYVFNFLVLGSII